MNTNPLSTNIVQRMRELGLTQKQLAERSGVSQPMVHKLVSGKVTATSKIIDIARALECSPEFLMGFSEIQKSRADPSDASSISFPMMCERILERRKLLGLTQQQVATIIGVTKVTISQWENGSTSPNGENSYRLAKALECAPEWLLYGQEKKPAPNAVTIGEFATWEGNSPLEDDEVEVPFYTEVELAAGSGAFAIREHTSAKIRFSKTTLRRQGVDPLNAVGVRVTGNSMEPVLPNGCSVGVDMASTKIVDGKMYAINHDGMLRVKLLYRLPGNGLRLRSYNQDEYPDEIYPGEKSASIQIIGKVFWYSVLL